MFTIKALDKSQSPTIQQRIDEKTKPPGSLGLLESLALQLALITSDKSNNNGEKIVLNKPTMLVFAGDHGIAEEGVSIAPAEVTQQMVLNFAAGGAAINCFSQLNNMALKVIDCGILNPVDSDKVIDQRLGAGTANFSQQAAMTSEQVELGFTKARNLVKQLAAEGCNIIGLGEMGIANTSAASALMAATLKLDAKTCVGLGTGINSEALAKKQQLIGKALKLHQATFNSPIETLAAVGGFEIVQMTGAILAAAENNMLVLIDGFIATAAALMAYRIDSNCKDYMVFCHQSGEQGHKLLLEHLQAEPLLQLGMRLGEGTGAALAMNLLYAARDFYNNMATFASANVTEV